MKIQPKMLLGLIALFLCVLSLWMNFARPSSTDDVYPGPSGYDLILPVFSLFLILIVLYVYYADNAVSILAIVLATLNLFVAVLVYLMIHNDSVTEYIGLSDSDGVLSYRTSFGYYLYSCSGVVLFVSALLHGVKSEEWRVKS